MSTKTDSFTCWRDASHTTIKPHPKFGWPECVTCRAAPSYAERPDYLPDDFTLTVYVPDTDLYRGLVARGSGIVGLPNPERITVYYEGWIHGAAQYEGLDARGKWEGGLLHAAGRMVVNYPTTAALSLPVAELKAIGTYHYKSRTVTVTDEAALTEWLAWQG